MIEEYLVRHELLSYNVPKKLIRSQAPGEDPEKYLSNIFFTTQEEIVSICQVSIKYNRQVTERPSSARVLHSVCGFLPLTSNHDQICRYYHRRYLKERLHSSSSKEASAYQQHPASTQSFDGEHYFRVLHEMVGFYIRLEVR